MKQLEQFFLLIDQCLNDTKFIRKHALSEKDFTRNRILTFRNTFWGLLAHTGASLQSEIPLLTRKFCGKIPPVSPQAFSKARNKMNYTSCKEIFEFSAKKLIFHKQYKGYFLAAVDASKILPPDTFEIRNVLGTCGNQFSERAGALISLLYDPLSDHIINGILSNCNESERKNLYTLIEQTHLENTILLLDRGYPGKEVYRFLSQHKLKYVIRMGIGNSNPRYIRESINADQISTDIKNPDITHRIIRFKLNDNSEELLITNIYDTQFTVDDFKTLYHFRWPIETKYDELKNKFQLEKFTGKTLNSVYQDFYNQMTKLNIISYLRQISSLEINSVGHKKKISIQASIKVFLFYLPQLLHDTFRRIEIIHEICMLLKKILFPVRDGRSFSRKKKHTDRKYRYNLK